MALPNLTLVHVYLTAAASRDSKYGIAAHDRCIALKGLSLARGACVLPF